MSEELRGDTILGQNYIEEIVAKEIDLTTLASGIVLVNESKPEVAPKLSEAQKYFAAHCRCPECGHDEIESTCTGGPIHDASTHRDNNRTSCVRCGWRGHGYDLVGKADPAELSDPDDRLKAEAALSMLWQALNLASSIEVPGSADRRRMWDEMAQKILGYGIPYGESH